jgi:hypothetical protein
MCVTGSSSPLFATAANWLLHYPPAAETNAEMLLDTPRRELEFWDWLLALSFCSADIYRIVVLKLPAAFYHAPKNSDFWRPMRKKKRRIIIIVSLPDPRDL